MMGDDDLKLTMGAAASAVERRYHITQEMLDDLDFGDKSSRVCLIFAVNVACIVLIGVIVATRLLVRRLMTRQFFLDDTLISIAAFFTIALCGICILALHHGFGQHVWNLDPSSVFDDTKKCVQLMFIGNIFYACAVTFTKLSIIASYLRIFPYNTLRVFMYVVASVTLGLFVASIPATIFQCTPVSAAWDFGDDIHRTAKCYTFINFLYASTAINVTTDLALCTAPLPYFWSMQMPRKQKIIVSSLFFLGGFACVASIVRLTFLPYLGTSIDVTWHLAPSVLWTAAECTIGICCVSVPPMRPLFSRCLPDVFLTRRGGGGMTTLARETAERRRAYAMGGYGGSEEIKTPTDEEQAVASQSDLAPSLAGREEVPASWLGGDGGRETRGRAFTVTTCEAGATIEKPERVLWKG